MSYLLSPSTFRGDVLWSIASLIVLGLCGVVINTVIGRYLGSDALGLFNEVFAVYIILSQLCVAGVHFSVLSYVSRNQYDLHKCADIATSGLLVATALSMVFCGITYAFRSFAGTWFGDDRIVTGLSVAIPGVFFFAVNKVLLSVLNGVGHIKAFAIFQSARYVLILCGVLAVIAWRFPAHWLPATLTFSECILLLSLFTYIRSRLFAFHFTARNFAWARAHLSFGTRGLLSGVFSEMNTRVDVVLLGYFLSQSRVGVYSLAAIVAEGINQLPFAVRRVIDPGLGRAFAVGNTTEIELEARNIRRFMYPTMALLGIIATVIFVLGAKVVFPPEEQIATCTVFAILMIGIVIQSGYRPLFGILLQAGFPGAHTWVVAAVLVVNVVCNVCLIPIFEIRGAAAATSLALLFEAFVFVYLSKKLLAVRLW